MKVTAELIWLQITRTFTKPHAMEVIVIHYLCCCIILTFCGYNISSWCLSHIMQPLSILCTSSFWSVQFFSSSIQYSMFSSVTCKQLELNISFLQSDLSLIHLTTVHPLLLYSCTLNILFLQTFYPKWKHDTCTI